MEPFIKTPDQQVLHGAQNAHGRFFSGASPPFEMAGVIGADHDDAEFGFRLGGMPESVMR